ncbi:amidase [Allosphingosinicella flava]|uniref:Amidase n=1 Tax=Allosphingosinicella flava TaxID=2771430 RepID=A0A7T2LLU4_9SPHN|nr:amidase [Sphingosinicella flava]QPQ54743.1 amidase [Sphingosinicella flava]
MRNRTMLTAAAAISVCVPATVAARQYIGPATANTAHALERIEELNPRLNAVIAVDPTAMDQAVALDRQKRARGPIYSMPILVKDNIETKGPLPTTAGSLALKDNVTNRDAPLVANLRAAGAVIVGKANLSEWANIRSSNSISGWSAVGGQVRNPHALDRNPCGSSSGSGAAVAAGMVPAAIGTETDGSITCPAAVNGIVGFKPTVGLVSRTHVVPISHSQDTAGPMTRTVQDAALVLSAMAGSDPADRATQEADARKTDYAAALSADSLKGKRIGVLRFATGFGTDAAFAEALETLKKEGAILVDIAKLEGRDQIGENEFKVLLAETKADINAYLATTPPSVKTRTLADIIAFNKANGRELALFGQDIFEQAEVTKGLDDPDYKKARETSLRLAGAEGIDKLLKDNDVVALVGPTMPAAWLIDSVHGDQISGGGAGSLAAVAGYPHLTVPMGTVKGLPVGLSFMGPKWSDALILSLGYDYEQASQKRVEPKLLESIETAPDVAPLLAPVR